MKSHNVFQASGADAEVAGTRASGKSIRLIVAIFQERAFKKEFGVDAVSDDPANPIKDERLASAETERIRSLFAECDRGRRRFSERRRMHGGNPNLKTVDEARNWADENFKGWAESLTRREIEGLRSYQNAPHKIINDVLRGKAKAENPRIEEDIRQIESAIHKGELKHDIILYRTMDAQTALKLSRLQSPFADKGFMSASLYPGGVIGKKKPYALFIIKAPKGTHAAYPNHVTGKKEFVRQQEILLQRGTKLKCSSPVSDNEGNYIIHAEIVNGHD